MIHEVKIPTGCKASVSVDNEKIVVLIDPVEDFVKIDEGALKKRFTDEVEAKALEEYHRKAVAGALSGQYSLIDSQIKYIPDTDNQGTIMSGVVLTEYEVNKSSGVLCDKDNRILSNVYPGMVVRSETGHIALVGSSDYTVVLTPNKEIQLNQTCNFPFQCHATKEEIEELFEQLKMQKALQVSSSGMLKNWDPDNDEKYEVLDSLFDPVPIKCSYSSTYVRLRDAGNMFPVGFITEERQQQLKETLKNLFDSWRK